jgi:hypothetical protein
MNSISSIWCTLCSVLSSTTAHFPYLTVILGRKKTGRWVVWRYKFRNMHDELQFNCVLWWSKYKQHELTVHTGESCIFLATPHAGSCKHTNKTPSPASWWTLTSIDYRPVILACSLYWSTLTATLHFPLYYSLNINYHPTLPALLLTHDCVWKARKFLMIVR